MDEPPHSLHWCFWRPCWHILDPPHSLHWCFCRPCTHTPAPLQSLHIRFRRPCVQTTRRRGLSDVEATGRLALALMHSAQASACPCGHLVHCGGLALPWASAELSSSTWPAAMLHRSELRHAGTLGRALEDVITVLGPSPLCLADPSFSRPLSRISNGGRTAEAAMRVQLLAFLSPRLKRN